MTEIVRIYGRGLAGTFIGLVVAWLALLIVAPQLSMIDRAFLYQDRGGAQAMLALEIDRAYQRVFQIDQEIDGMRAAAGPARAGTPSPGAAPSPGFGPGAAKGFGPGAAQQTLSPEAATERLAALQAEKRTLQAAIADLEAQESGTSGEAGMEEVYSLDNFTSMSAVHFEIFVATIVYAFCVTLLAFCVCYPVAYAVASSDREGKVAVLMLGLVVPYAINELLRIFSWVMILDRQGLLNGALDAIGLIDLDAGEGFRFVASNGAVFVVMAYAYVLFMVFPIYNTIETLDRNQIEAARDLGASVWRIHARVVIPHAKPGIAVGSIMTFMLSAGSIAVPEIVGRGLHPDWFSQVIYRRFFEADSWNQGSAYSLALLAACIAFILVTMAIFRVGIRDIAK